MNFGKNTPKNPTKDLQANKKCNKNPNLLWRKRIVQFLSYHRVFLEWMSGCFHITDLNREKSNKKCLPSPVLA